MKRSILPNLIVGILGAIFYIGGLSLLMSWSGWSWPDIGKYWVFIIFVWLVLIGALFLLRELHEWLTDKFDK